MRLSLLIKIAGLGVAGLAVCAQTPESSGQPASASLAKPSAVNEIQGLPPRTAPSDYQAQAKAGTVTIAAEFAGHSLPTPEGPLSTEDYVVVEVAFFGPPASRLPLSFSNFALRINEKKSPTVSESYERVMRSVKDPEWIPPETDEKSKSTMIGTGGGNDVPPPPPKMPPELQHKLVQRVRKASLANGDLPLPQAGLLYFPYGGKEKGIRSLELTYLGPAGKTTLTLHP